jgi:hypothetical protein
VPLRGGVWHALHDRPDWIAGSLRFGGVAMMLTRLCGALLFGCTCSTNNITGPGMISESALPGVVGRRVVSCGGTSTARRALPRWC